MGAGDIEFKLTVDAIVEAAPRLREAGVARLSIGGVEVDLAPVAPGKPLSAAEQDALEARLHKLEQERATRDEEERRRIQLAASGGFRRRA